MALITLQQMYDAWKRVADWVSGANTDKPPVKVTDGTDTLAINPDGSLPVQLTGSNVESAVNFTTSHDMVVTAGSNATVYSNVNLSKYTHISGIFMMSGIIWPHKIYVQWRNSRDSTVVSQVLTEIGDAHKVFAPVPVITQRANISVRNEDTVDRKIYTLDVYGHVRG